jgi:osmotically-inducible protein OsmY
MFSIILTDGRIRMTNKGTYSITMKNNIVYLKGEIERDVIKELVRTIQSINSVIDVNTSELHIVNVKNAKQNDLVLAGKVKGLLEKNKNRNKIKVTTKNGIVFLSGNFAEIDENLAIKLVRQFKEVKDIKFLNKDPVWRHTVN